MKSCTCKLMVMVALWLGGAGLGLASNTNLDKLGVTLLRQIDPTLTGSGVRIAQVEAPESTATPTPFEVNPATVGQPLSLFTYTSSSGTATSFPNSVGAESSHADAVANNYYSLGNGVASQVSHVDNYEANYFLQSVITALLPPTIPARIVNQSFLIGTNLYDQDYDNYADNNNTLFISGAGNGDPVQVGSPASCYNGLGVGVYDGLSSIGPTYDGRCKPDLTAPGSGATSFSTPYVSGSAAVLLQAANRGDGGANTTAAGDLRTLKALLLNGAVKPANWTNGPATPLDARYGAGILNLFNAWNQLRGGQHAFIESTSNSAGAAHPPGTSPNNEPVLTGWDYNTLTNPHSGATYKEAVNHYYFYLAPAQGSRFTLTATLVWNRHANQPTASDLNLFLYNVSTTNLVLCSTSAVDNVEHLFVPNLPAGRYDLQVQKSTVGLISTLTTETYALAFESFNLKLSSVRTNNAMLLSWPVAPAGFTLQSATNLVAPIWSPVAAPVVVTNNQNTVSVPTSAPEQFFRLQRP